MDNFAIGTVGVAVLVLGLVQFCKKLLEPLGLDGNWYIVLALLFGFVFGGLAYGVENTLIPAGWVPYIEWAVTALAVGLSAAGFYDLGKSRFGRD